MLITIFWFIALIAYSFYGFFQLTEAYKSSDLILILSGFSALLTSFLKSLYQNNLGFYLYWNKFKNWFRNYPSVWKLNIRYDGPFNQTIINEIEKFLSSYKKHSIKVKHRNNNTLEFFLNESLLFFLVYQSKESNLLDYDSIDIDLTPFEIGANTSRKRLHNIIIPFLTEFQTAVRPQNTSYILNIAFSEGNPFFSIFTSHLKSSIINSFTINLIINEYSDKDIVTINKENIILNANTLYGFDKLSSDFIYLSTNVKQYLRTAQNA